MFSHKKQICLLSGVLAACTLIVTGGCGSASDSSTKTAAHAVNFVDCLGDTLTLTSTPRRIVTLAPNLTELVYALGVQNRLVGVTEHCDFPPGAESKPKVALFNAVNIEALTASKPDLVLAARGNNEEDIIQIRRLGIAVYGLCINGLDDLLTNTSALGAVLGVTPRSDSLVASWRARIDRVTERPVTHRPRVFFGGVEEPIYSVGPGAYLHEIIVSAGGDNILGDAAVGWPRIDLESLVRRNPEVMIISYSNEPDAMTLARKLDGRSGWNSVDAVRNRRIKLVGDEALRPGPRMVDALELFARAIHPENYAE